MSQARAEWDTPMYRLALSQLDRAAESMGLDENIWERLRTPQRAHVVSFPFRRDAYDRVETVYGDYDKSPFTKDSKEQIFVARPELNGV